MQLELKNLLRSIRVLHCHWIWFLLTILIIGIYTSLGPVEHSLGTHIRIVYLHGAWVWASLAAYLAAGVFGGLGLLTNAVQLERFIPG
jgi:hypothetical protein